MPEMTEHSVEWLCTEGLALLWSPSGDPLDREWTEEPERTLEALEHVSASSATTVEETERLFRVLAELWSRNGPWSLSLAETHLLVGEVFSTLLTQLPMSVSSLGTIWRLMRRMLGESTGGSSMGLMWGWLDSAHMPVPILAGCVENLVELNHLPAGVLKRVARKGVAQYPELAGLPVTLVLQVAASFPVPDEWFVDVFPLPADVKYLAPGVTRDGHN